MLSNLFLSQEEHLDGETRLAINKGIIKSVDQRFSGEDTMVSQDQIQQEAVKVLEDIESDQIYDDVQVDFD